MATAEAPTSTQVPEASIGRVDERELPAGAAAAPHRRVRASAARRRDRVRRVRPVPQHHRAGGAGVLWAGVLGLLTQYFINMEIERYTLATGETAVTGFPRLWKPFGLPSIAWRSRRRFGPAG